MPQPIQDAAERAVARDPERSVIVQAPAGSGKTELLMQRFLALLARVDSPEEILAVTFTRKAAAEMRHRILQALCPPAEDNRLPETVALAEQVMQRDAEKDWGLLNFPGRLRIRTLDSVNSWVAGSAPVSGDGTAGNAVSDRPDELYELAASRALEFVAEDSAFADHIAVVLSHLDNRAELFVSLMAQMLHRRDQWLPVVGSGQADASARAQLESSLHELVAQRLQQAHERLPAEARAALASLLNYAASQLALSQPDGAVQVWRQSAEFPQPEPEWLGQWRSMAEFLLVKSSANGAAFRKTVNKTNGFPTPKDGGDKAMTELAKSLLEQFALTDGLAELFAGLRALPDPHYSDEQWQALEALIRVLPVVAAELLVVFRERGETDYIQIATEARQALGGANVATDLALRLDYQIRHILIDEFQDTSRTQLRLLQSLTAGWQPGDGRTLFVVGDPMQSIYRFRQAEVAVFLQLWEQGIGQIPLEPVRLTTNFRSAPAVVEWVNQTFAELMPEVNDPASGAVQFARGTPFKPGSGDSCVLLHACEQPARVDESVRIAELVESALAADSEGTVGILVRTRHQARLIVRELRNRGIRFSGEALEQPGETAVEQDLIALTRALTHLGDRTAWLALLRSPYCGLTLVDTERLCGEDLKAPLLSLLRQPEAIARLSADGQTRAMRLLDAVEAVLPLQGTLPLRDWIEGAWQRLQGPAALQADRELYLAEQFFASVEKLEAGGTLAEAYRLHERLGDRQDQSTEGKVRVHLLTLFKAKGLEYDTVILPALDGTTRVDAKDAVAWHEFSTGGGDSVAYLMAPIEATGADTDSLHGLIRQFKREQAEHELDRFLYVAATRAKQHLHLFFGLDRKSSGDLAAPRNGSLLKRLWPVIGGDYEDFSAAAGTPEARDDWQQLTIRRLPSNWQGEAAPAAVTLAAGAAPEVADTTVSYDWAGSDAMRVGTVVHRCLQFAAETGLPAWDDQHTAAAATLLLEEGVGEADLSAALEKVATAMRATLEDSQGRWILEPHADAACEKPVTAVINGRPQRFVLDRCFVDSAGDRWIIDYKISSHEGGSLEAFIASEVERYGPQLEQYRAVMANLEPGRRIRTGLYFPLLGVFKELAGAP
jgi:ATP-dependent helicase/nuclease subunit A